MIHQKLPTNWSEREALREKGQFWTPDWIASAMVAYAVSNGTDHVFDPAVGAGAFFRAAQSAESSLGKHLRLLGCEIDANALNEATSQGLCQEDISEVEITDFVLHPPAKTFQAIVANPPYVRHHRLSQSVKKELKKLSLQIIGKSLDGRAGLHIYFLLRALQLLGENGHLAFIIPADTCEGVFAGTLWTWITRVYRLDAVVTFAPEASPFPGVDTNPVIIMIKNAPPKPEFTWARCLYPRTNDLARWIASGFIMPTETLSVHKRTISEGISTGLSRPPSDGSRSGGPVLGDYARVLRGIATGDNDFFFLTSKRAEELGIPRDYLLTAVGRTRDIPSDVITGDLLGELDSHGRPTLLLSVNGVRLTDLPQSVRDYIEYGEKMGLPKKALISTRRPWYKMESRPIPPVLFSYLGRRNARFVRNLAGVLPLTGFLCVYPYSEDKEFMNRLWQVLQHPDTIANLALVGKSYGSGAVKVEPRGLERLPLPMSVVSRVGLLDYRFHDQPTLVMAKKVRYQVDP